MKLLNKFKDLFDSKSFDLEYEAEMVQSRLLSTILEIKEKAGMSQEKLAELTGLTQPFISAIFNNRKKLNMEHIALFQNALDFKLQPPKYLSSADHKNKFYSKEDYAYSHKHFHYFESNKYAFDLGASYLDNTVSELRSRSRNRRAAIFVVEEKLTYKGKGESFYREKFAY